MITARKTDTHLIIVCEVLFCSMQKSNENTDGNIDLSVLHSLSNLQTEKMKEKYKKVNLTNCTAHKSSQLM